MISPLLYINYNSERSVQFNEWVSDRASNDSGLFMKL